MSILKDKKILIGVTAGIAAYKAASVVRAFIKKGAEVKVVMTDAAKDFVTPLTLSTLSKNPVQSTFYEKNEENELWNNHVELGLWADYFVIAPATANTLSKMAHGKSDNLLLATYLSAKCPVYFAPAMDLDMYKHPSTGETFEKLVMIPATSGELASGLVGQGRMAEPDDIVDFVENDILGQLPLKGKHVLLTAGPTYESIDPVRFIGNHSTGRMGIEIANSAVNLGAEVTLVLGPSSITGINDRVNLVRVTNAESMFLAVKEVYNNVDIAIASAAVADYRPKTVAAQKIKKKEGDFSIELERTTDILNAKSKLIRKNLDLIVLNSLNDKGAGFKGKTNKVTFINHKQEVKPFDLKNKAEVAQDILLEIQDL